jgi:hypothetical protein
MKMKNGDCGICCFAMVADISYEDAWEFFKTKVWEKDKNRKVPLVWKYEMEKALMLSGLEYYKISSYEDFEKLKGSMALLHPRAPGFFRHWIIYLPEENYVIDPDPKQPNEVTDFARYKALRKYFCII